MKLQFYNYISLFLFCGQCFSLDHNQRIKHWGSFLQLKADSSPTYSDGFARNKMFPLAAAAYSDDPKACLKNRFNTSELINQYVAQGCALLLNDSCSGYTAVLHQEKAIVMSFRGTESIGQLVAEVYETAFKNKVQWEMGGSVNLYFSNSFKNIWKNGMSEDVVKLLKRYQDYEVWITGHSLGGSLSSLASSYIVGKGLVDKNRVKLINFGSPRTGDYDFAKQHSLLVPYSFRVVHNRDSVTTIPKVAYFHIKREVVYNEEMGEGEYYHICQDNDMYCIYYSRGSIPDHFTYFDRPVGPWGRSGCE